MAIITNLMIPYLTLLFLAFVATTTSFHLSPPRRTQSLRTQYKMANDLTVEEISSKYKRIVFGQGPSAKIGIETTDKAYKIKVLDFEIDRKKGGSLGLELIEGANGIVFVGAVKPNSPGASFFSVGDSIISFEGYSQSDDKSTRKASLEGLGLDDTIDCLSEFGAFAYNRVKVKRLVKRAEIVVQIYGPSDEYVMNVTALSGYGVNLRTALNSYSIKLYDERTARFDSPYQTGNCGGEGTCGTCIVAVTQGASLLNERVRVEDAGLSNQGAPPSWRWSCRYRILNPLS
jgi:hypothetical protein